MDKEYLSKEKYEELGRELDYLRRQKRKEVAERLESARSLGDLSENAEYHSARDEQAETEARIEQLKDLLKRAEIIKHVNKDSAEVGSTVTLQKKGEKDKVEYTIVGSEESDLSAGKISYQSPLGAAILGKKKKDEFSFETPKGVVEYVVVDIK
ncbi:transcription elongation factor GreA [Candidatus Parcubacteria bacterium]|nr:transcription elongation factor GreA [Candidatus Parcubacteria bacterium]